MVALLTAAVVISGTLAPADPGVLEDVQDRRLRHGWGLDEAAPGGAVLLAVDDCRWLGYGGVMLVDGEDWYPVRAVDCCSQRGCLSSRQLAADVNRGDLGHKKGTIYLWSLTEKKKLFVND